MLHTMFLRVGALIVVSFLSATLTANATDYSRVKVGYMDGAGYKTYDFHIEVDSGFEIPDIASIQRKSYRQVRTTGQMAQDLLLSHLYAPNRQSAPVVVEYPSSFTVVEVDDDPTGWKARTRAAKQAFARGDIEAAMIYMGIDPTPSMKQQYGSKIVSNSGSTAAQRVYVLGAEGAKTAQNIEIINKASKGTREAIVAAERGVAPRIQIDLYAEGNTKKANRVKTITKLPDTSKTPTERKMDAVAQLHRVGVLTDKDLRFYAFGVLSDKEVVGIALKAWKASKPNSRKRGRIVSALANLKVAARL